MSSEAVAGGEIDSRSARETLLDAAPVCLVAGAAVVGLASAQGGYFSTSWGWASTRFSGWSASGPWRAGAPTRVASTSRSRACSVSSPHGVAASTAWSVAPSLTVLELQRLLVYLAGVGAVLLVTRRRDLGWLVATLVAAITGVAVYALATRLFPDHFEGFDPIAVYRLSEPVGYWNGLGFSASWGSSSPSEPSRTLDRGPTRARRGDRRPVLGRALLHLQPRRLARVGGRGGGRRRADALPAPLRRRLLAAGVPAGLAVLVASRSEALTNRTADLERAVSDGRRLALVVVALSVAAGLAAWLFHVAERRVSLPRGAHIGATVAIVALLGVGVVAAIAEYGGPSRSPSAPGMRSQAAPRATSTT